MKQLLQKACNALKYLKDKNIVHRDIKLENLLIKKLDNEEIDIVLIDFGFIKNLNNTPSVYRIGTVRYIAPEILVSNDDISVKPYSAKSDIYSLAVTLFKLMSNDNVIDIAQTYHFFKDDKKVKEELRKKIKENDTVKYSDEFINLILKMLERNVNDRYDVEDVLFEIKNLNQKEQYLLKQNKLKKKKEKLIGFSNKFNYVSQFGSYGKENDQFNDILDILIDSTCNEQLYIVDSKNCRISIFNLNGEYLKQFKLAFEPSCITLDNVTDTLLIGDYNNSIIYRYSKSGKLIDQYGTTGNEKNWYISGIVMDPLSTTGNFYVSNYTENKIQLFSRDGKLLNEFKENIQKPNDIIFNDKNQFIISDGQDKCLKLFNKQGQLIKRFGDYHFKNPRGLLFDSVKKQYIICDELSDNLVVLNEKGGLIACPFGKNGKGQEEFQVPVNLALNYKTGMLYVVDWGNVCIKLFK